jgi:glycosyltransferase involved in cell wall biosynthesis
MTEVSVVIPTFNRWPMVVEAVASVMAQSGVGMELIIVDDGSTDGTAEGLPRLAEELRTAERPVRILRTPNRGPAAARNKGVADARAPFIAFLDSDDLWQPFKLQRQLEYIRRRPECLVLQTDEIWMRKGLRVNPGRRHRKRGGDFFIDSLRTCLVSPSAVMMSTSSFCQVGGFDEHMRAGEDYDLWLRFLLEHQIEFLPEPLVIRRAGHPGQLSATVPAIDRFRILALLKLLLRNDLNCWHRDSVCDVLIEKCGIYGQGATRRGHAREAEWIASLAERGDKVWRRFPDDSLENAIEKTCANLAKQDFSMINSRNEDDELRKI